VADNRPVRYESGDPARVGGGLPAVGRPASAPIHAPGEMPFGDPIPTREELWEQLSPAVRARIDQRVGRIVEWWANEVDGRPSVVVFGTHGLVVVEPTVNGTGAQATRLSTIALDAASFRSVRVTGPALWRPPAATPKGGSGAPDDPELAAMLGHLPARAQQLLQDPFLGGGRPLQFEYFYLRTSGGRGLAGATLQWWCYLTDLRTLTFAAGVGHGLREGRGPESWDLTCWRVTVVPRPAGPPRQSGR
jgi:hypothetical protein